jgi:uncharacterized protein YndB with AHSA1/START domain
MTDTAVETRAVVMERELPHSPDKVWRALTQPHLIEAWLMKADFQPTLGHRFSFQAEWGVVDCEVTAVEPGRSLAYTWTARGLDSVVTWTLTPTPAGTHLRMEQTGFRRDHPQAYGGAMVGWPRFLGRLEEVLAGLD